MKSRLHKFFAILMCCMIAILFVGCGGNDSNFYNDLKQQLDNGEITEEEFLQKRMDAMSVPLYGSKVLYRPDDYDWEENVGGGNENYYEQYAWWLLAELESRYAFLDADDELLYPEENPQLTLPESDEATGYYDSMRYQMQSYDIVTLQKIELDESNEPKGTPEEKKYLQLSVNTAKQWTWSLGDQVKSAENQAYIYDTDNFNRRPQLDGLIPIPSDGILFGNEYYPSNEAEIKGNIVSNVNADRNIENNYYENYMIYLQGNLRDTYSANTFINSYSQAYLGTDYGLKRENLTNQTYSDYVKALEYAIYCINLDLAPNTIDVTYDNNGMPIVKVDRYDAVGNPGDENYKSSATVALEDIQKLFKQLGTYVGVTERQQTRLVNWILDNVIGDNSDSEFTISSTERTLVQYVKKVKVDTNGDKIIDENDGEVEVMCDEEGHEVTEFSPVEKVDDRKELPSIPVNRDYKNTVRAIVEICTNEVYIGNTNKQEDENFGTPNPDDPHISDRYPASNVVDYWGNDFFTTPDGIFPNEVESLAPAGVKTEPLEYQSVALMFAKEFEFSNLWIGFKYDADLDGDEKYDPNKSLVINVHVYLYSHANNYYREAGVVEDGQFYQGSQIEVFDGPFDYGQKRSMLMLNGICDPRNGENGFGGYAIKCGEFNTGIGGGILQSLPDYSGKYSIGVPLPLSGNDNRRNYYQLVDGETEDNKYYSYGILNPNMFAGADGCDYVEIAYEIVKVKGDNNTNYKFYTGVMLVA